MEYGIFWAIYFLIGMIYTLINGFVRKLDTDGDWLLPIFWLLLWPIAFIGLAIITVNKYFERRIENRKSF